MDRNTSGAYLVRVIAGHKFDFILYQCIVIDRTRAYEIAEALEQEQRDLEEEEWKQNIFARVSNIDIVE